jgi:ABC-type uncharacterized transport system substrate-binding protein
VLGINNAADGLVLCDLLALAVLVNSASPTGTESTLRDVEAAARAMGLQIQVVDATTSREIESTFAGFARERPDALFVGPPGHPAQACKALRPATLTSRGC